MKKIVLLLLSITCFFGYSQEFQEKYQRAKIYYSQNQSLGQLENLGIPVEHGIHKKGYFVISDFSVSEIEKARNAGYTVDILIEDAKEYFLQQNRENKAPLKNPSCGENTVEYQTPTNFNLGSMGGYLTYQEMLNELDQMKALYPNLITTKSNISTFLTEGTPDNATTPSIGSNGIKWVKISDNPNANNEGEPQILHTAIHHAREPASLSQLIFYMWYLLENYETNPEIKSIVDNTEIYFVPVINPDGYLYNEKTDPNGGGFWRKNRKNSYGIDLNRNYDYFINGDSNQGVWGGEGASGDTNDQTYHGSSPFSEVEVQAMKWFVENHNFVMAFNNHTSGNLLLFPYGYTDNAPTPENNLFEGISSELVSKNGFQNMISSDLYPAAGDSDDFMYGTVGTHNKIYAFTPEIGPSFWPPSNQIEDICKSMMYLNLTAAKMVNNYASLKDTSSKFVGSNLTINNTFDVKRLGISGSGNFTVSINPISSNIISVGSSVTFSSLNPLEESDGTISYALNNSIVDGEDIVFELIINNGSFDAKVQLTKKFGSLTSIFEDAGDSVDDNFNNDGWDTTTSTYVSPSSSITDSPNGNYQNNQHKFITLSNAINLTTATAASVSFYAKWEIENNWDYVQFEVSTNNGGTWIPQCGKFTNDGSDNNGQPTGEPLYDGTQNSWVLEEIDLSDYLGETILVRFEFESDGFQRADGFYFDDLTFSVIDENLEISSFSTNSFKIYPNPVKNQLIITTVLTQFNLELYNLQGQMVEKQSNISGTQIFDFSSISSGFYLLKVYDNTISKTFKVIKE